VLNPIRSEGDAFRLVLYIAAAVVVIAVIVVVARAL